MAERKEVREMIGAWRDVGQKVRAFREGGFTAEEKADIKAEVVEALDETIDVLVVGAEKAKLIKDFLQEHL
jgi:hypothetical protein